MIGLVFYELLLFAIAAVIGAAIGWFVRAQLSRITAGAVARDVETLRAGLNEARVRRVRA